MEFIQLPSIILQRLFSVLNSADAKALRSCCKQLRVVGASRLSTLRVASLLQGGAGKHADGTQVLFTPEALPSLQRLDYRFSDAVSSSQLIALLKQHPALEAAVCAVRLSGRDGLTEALEALQLCCPDITSMDIRCQHHYRGRHKECGDLSKALTALEVGWPHLTELHLSRFPLSEAQLEHLCTTFLQLRSLSVRGLRHAIHCESVLHLEQLSCLTSLCVDHLTLRGGAFPAAPQLRVLELSDANITEASFASLNALTSLESLSIWGSGHRSAVQFSPLTGLQQLRRLHMELPLDDAMVAGLAACTALASISVQTARVMAAGAAGACAPAQDAGVVGGVAVAALPPAGLGGVTKLSLQCLDKECLPLAAWLPGLRTLVLESGEGMWRAVASHPMLTVLQALENGPLPPQWGQEAATCCSEETCGSCLLPPPQLARLKLGKCQDLHEHEYASAGALPRLAVLSLSGCQGLTDDALAALLAGLPALQELELEAATHITDGALQALAQHGGVAGGGPLVRAGQQGPERALAGSEEDGKPAGSSVAVEAAAAAVSSASGGCSSDDAGSDGRGRPHRSSSKGDEVAAWLAVASLGGAACVCETAGSAGGAGSGGCRGGAVSKGAPVPAVGVCPSLGGMPAAPAAGATAARGSHLQCLELVDCPLITARGVADAVVGLPGLLDLHLRSCQAVCRESVIWLPQALGRPGLAVVCSHAAVYDE